MSTETRSSRWQDWLKIAALVFACLSSGLSLGAIVIKGGWILHTIVTQGETLTKHDVRITKIEADGSPKIGAHEKLDDERDARNRERIAAVEAAAKEFTSGIIKMSETMGKMSQKIDDLKDQLQTMRYKQ